MENQLVEHGAETEHVHLGGVGLTAVAEYLGGSVAQGAAVVVPDLVVLEHGQPEVDQHWHQPRKAAEHDVVGLDVPVRDAVAVQLLHRQQQPVHDLADLVLVQLVLRGQHVRKQAAFDQLHDHVDRVLGLVDLQQGDHPRVRDLAQTGDLVHHRHCLGLREGLYCYPFLVHQPHRLVNRCVTSCPDLLLCHVVVVKLQQVESPFQKINGLRQHLWPFPQQQKAPALLF
jgi:hypothetical protein